MAPILDHDVFSRLVGEIYDSVAEPGRWSVFLDDLSVVLNGHATMLAMEDFRCAQASIASAVKVDVAVQREYEQYYAKVNVWMKRAAAEWQEGTVNPGESVCTTAEVESSEYYNDYLRRLDLFHAAGAFIRKDAQALSAIYTLRPRRLGPWGSELQTIMLPLMPHLQRALELHRRLRAAEGASRVTANVLDRLHVGIILLNQMGSPLLVNKAASDIVSTRDGLTIERTGLTAATSSGTTAIRRAIGQAVACSSGKEIEGGGVLTLGRPSGKRPLHVLVSPVPSENGWGPGDEDAHAVLLLTDPDAGPRPSADVVAKLFGLTPTEAVVAIRLASGERVEEVGAHLSLTNATVRWHVKHILSKLGVRSQAQLVRLILASPAVILPPPA